MATIAQNNCASVDRLNGHPNRVKVVLGAQWGDEGKGKLVDLLAEHADVVARCQVMEHPESVHAVVEAVPIHMMWQVIRIG